MKNNFICEVLYPVIFVTLILILLLIVVSAANNEYEHKKQCEANNGVMISKTQLCISKDALIDQDQ